MAEKTNGKANQRSRFASWLGRSGRAAKSASMPIVAQRAGEVDSRPRKIRRANCALVRWRSLSERYGIEARTYLNQMVDCRLAGKLAEESDTSGNLRFATQTAVTFRFGSVQAVPAMRSYR